MSLLVLTLWFVLFTLMLLLIVLRMLYNHVLLLGDVLLLLMIVLMSRYADVTAVAVCVYDVGVVVAAVVI